MRPGTAVRGEPPPMEVLEQKTGKKTLSKLGPPVVPFYPFWGRVPLLRTIDYRRKNGYPYSNLFSGGPSK